MKRADSIVFLGPSLPVKEAKRLLPASYRSPARQGDVFRAVAERPKAIVLIDGVFDTAPSVWHHELRAALASGIALYGASSMGALRAAELRSFGMVGVGEIFERYHKGSLVDDEAVALLHGPEATGFRPLTVPWVNAEATLYQARAAGVLSTVLFRRLLANAKRLHFRERTWRKIEADSQGADNVKLAAFTQWRKSALVDVKASDARLCLNIVAARSRSKPKALPVAASFSAYVRSRRWSDTHGDFLEQLSLRPQSQRWMQEGERILALSHWAKTLGLQVERSAVESLLQSIPVNGLAEDIRWQFAEALALEAMLRHHLQWVVSDAPTGTEALVLGALLNGGWNPQGIQPPLPSVRRF